VLCSRVFRNSVPNSIPPRERGRFGDVTCPALAAELVRRIGGLVPVGERGSRGISDESCTRRPPHWDQSGPRSGRPVRVFRTPNFQGGETPAQPVVGYVGYALKEPWGQPRAVIGFSADEAERLADFLQHGTAGQPTLVDLGAERSLRSLRAGYRVPRIAPASYQEPVRDYMNRG